MTVLIVHPGTGTIIDASESYIVIVDEDAAEDITEVLEGWDSFHLGAGPEGTKVHDFYGVVDASVRKQL
jgi:hypothetical protein